MDLPFDDAIAPRRAQGGRNCNFITIEMPGEGSERRVLCMFDPLGPSRGIACAWQVEERSSGVQVRFVKENLTFTGRTHLWRIYC